jgi:TolA-binding protein
MSTMQKGWSRIGAMAVVGLALGCGGCGGSERPVFTEAPAATVTVPPPVASHDPPPPPREPSDDDDPSVPVADDGMGSDVGSIPPGPGSLSAIGGGSLPAQTPHLLPARDPRAKSHPRPRALLVTELQGLTSLLAATAQSAPDRPQLLRRIADDYAELARTSLASGGPNDPVTRAARARAVDFYTQLEAVPAYGKLDEVLYYKGLELEMSGDLTGARRTYYDLIRKAPQSKLVGHAYFAFGEMFFDEAVADPSKNDLALQAYTEVLKQPASALAPESLLRSGQVAERKNDRPRALQFYKRLLQTHPGTSAASAVPPWASRP